MSTPFIFSQPKTSKYNPVVAHRGAWKEDKLPENSIAALRKAIKRKYMGSEFDVRMTADDVLVVNHDPSFQGLEIEKVMYSQLLDHKLSNGEKIPTLEEYLLAGMKKNKMTRLVLEIKPSEISKERGMDIAKKVYDLVTRMHAHSMVDYISFDINILKTLIQLNPNIFTQYLAGEISPQELNALGIKGLDYHFSVFKKNPDWIADAKKLNMKLNAWTVNDATDMDFFIQNLFDFITTNEPELLAKRTKSLKANLK
jgi:glycerophosphoryl diester phosphodiesterase